MGYIILLTFGGVLLAVLLFEALGYLDERLSPHEQYRQEESISTTGRLPMQDTYGLEAGIGAKRYRQMVEQIYEDVDTSLAALNDGEEDRATHLNACLQRDAEGHEAIAGAAAEYRQALDDLICRTDLNRSQSIEARRKLDDALTQRLAEFRVGFRGNSA